MLYSTEEEIESLLESETFIASYKPLQFITSNRLSFQIEYVYFNKMKDSLVLVFDFPHYIEIEYSIVKGRLAEILGCNSGNKVFKILLN